MAGGMSGLGNDELAVAHSVLERHGYRDVDFRFDVFGGLAEPSKGSATKRRTVVVSPVWPGVTPRVYEGHVADWVRDFDLDLETLRFDRRTIRRR